MDNGYSPLGDDEVLFVDRGRVLMSNPTFKVSEFLDALAQAVSDREGDWSEENEAWFSDGLECEALRFQSGGWQRGRVRIRVEFMPIKPQERLPERLPERLAPRSSEGSSARPPEPLTDRLRPRNIDDIYSDEDDY